jgi:hypothetical protein
VITEFMRHPRGKDIPSGWRVIEQAETHHHRWSVLIQRETAAEPHAPGAGNSTHEQPEEDK